ncbi:trypsin-like serine peptidase [Falsiroseomonas oryzae]|uniref:trypsin-like serine peptidase n=1 Tax=Falsiroseomonas oryzae TaxID=2766473 RepID=UPI0022EAF5B8|nr:serine protease [Roseomonas sp. MO-31]
MSSTLTRYESESDYGMPQGAAAESGDSSEIVGDSGMGTEFGQQVDESVITADDHSAVAGSGEEAGPTESVSEAAQETNFETGVEWNPAARTESMGEQEAMVDAYFASAPAVTVPTPQQQEIFGAIAAALVPIAKAVVPTLVAPLAKQAGSALANRARTLLRRFPGLPRIPGITETGGAESGMEFDGLTEASLVQLEQALTALEVVIGPDDRVQVKNTSQQPWRRICHLSIMTKTGASFLGTGFFIGPRTIATAGHCVYIKNHGGWAKQIVVTPGRNGSNKPFQSVTAVQFRSVKGWLAGKRDCDYGAIILPRSFNNPTFGAFGFDAWSDSQLRGAKLNLAGYPGDKPPGTMWYHGRVATGLSQRVITYDIDTAGGQSGSPVWVKKGDSRIVVGVHTNGASGGNSATRVVQPVKDNFVRWRKEGA